MSAHPVEQLRSVLQSEFATGLPPGVHPIAEWVADPQFFPGATGLLREERWEDVSPGQAGRYTEFPTVEPGGVIVLANYFASCATYEDVRSGKRGGLGRTWTPMRRLLAATSPQEVFLTNAYIGVADVPKDTTRFPTTPEFTQRCACFLRLEIDLLRPRAVVCLGKPAMKMLASVAPAQLSRWTSGSLPGLLQSNQRIVHGCRVGDVAFTAVAVSHPSAPGVSAEKRHLEAQLIAAAVRGG
jgi:hypothetical protein